MDETKVMWEGLAQLKHSTTVPDVLPQLYPYSQHVNHAFYLCHKHKDNQKQVLPHEKLQNNSSQYTNLREDDSSQSSEQKQ
jgi:hypothetical protein